MSEDLRPPCYEPIAVFGGTAITKVLPAVSRFSRTNSHSAKKQAVLDKLTAFFDRYSGLA